MVHTPLKFRKKVILFELETDYGVDPGPTGADAIQIVEATLTPLAGDTITRGVLRDTLGASPKLMTGLHVALDFTIEGAGSGTAGVAPAYGKVLRSLGLKQTIVTGLATIADAAVASGTPDGSFTYAKASGHTGTQNRTVTLTCTTGGGSGVAAFTVAAPAIPRLADAYNQAGVVMTDAQPFALPGGAVITPTVGSAFTAGDVFTIALTPPRVDYTPISDGFESGTIYFNLDKNIHPLRGFRGTASWDFSSKDFPKIKVSGKGLFTDPYFGPLPAVDYSAFMKPQPVSYANTPRFSIHGYDAVMKSLSAQLGNTVEHRDLVNFEGVVITDREASASLTIESSQLTDWDPFAAAKNGTLGSLQVEHGTIAGSILGLSAPQAQVTNPRYGEDSHITMLDADVTFVTGAGDDDLTFTVK